MLRINIIFNASRYNSHVFVMTYNFVTKKFFINQKNWIQALVISGALIRSHLIFFARNVLFEHK